MSTPAGDNYEPVKVHIVADATKGAAAAEKPSRPRRRTVFQTVVLTADDPVQVILPESVNREIAWVQALDNDVVLGSTRGQAGATVNTETGTPYPSGTIVPKANTGPYLVQDNGAIYAGVTTTAADSRIAISAVYRDDWA